VAIDPLVVVVSAGVGTAVGAFIRELLKRGQRRIKQLGLDSGDDGDGHPQLDTSEWRRKIDYDIYASEGHLHAKVHELENKVGVKLQELLNRLDKVGQEIAVTREDIASLRGALGFERRGEGRGGRGPTDGR
jgi:hypothetical protein